MDEYKTLLCTAEAEFTEKHSRFIADVSPVSSEEEAIKFLKLIKKKYKEATHNVYAYCIRNDNNQRYSDDGEPQGTAGVPTLEVLRREDLTDCIVVVTRYFGGILLGTGGLVRAYSSAAKAGVNASKVVTMKKCTVAKIIADYSLYSSVFLIIKKFFGIVENTIFADKVILEFYMPQDVFELFCKEITEQSAGKILPQIIEYVYKKIK